MTSPAERASERAGARADDGLELRLRLALARQASAVSADPPTAIRAGIDRRIARRTVARRRRRVIGSMVALLGAVAGVAVAGARGDDPGAERVDVAAGPAVGGDGSGSTEGHGDGVDPLGAAGLPRITLDAAPEVRPRATGDPVVQSVPVEPSELTQVQVFRPAGALVPVVIAPWSPEGATRDLPEPGADGSTTVDVNGTAAALAGEPPGWSTLAWPMDDGTKAYLYAFGTSRTELLDLARGLERAPAGAAGYQVGATPPELVEERAPLDPAAGTTRGYEVGYVDAAGDDAALLGVRREETGRFAERLIAGLASATEAHPIEVLGRPALLIRHGPSPTSRWSVLWQPADGITAELEILAADRAGADRLIEAVEQPDR